MKTKRFDCVEMKHIGAEKIRKKTFGMTQEQELLFWQERSRYLKNQQKAIKEDISNATT